VSRDKQHQAKVCFLGIDAGQTHTEIVLTDENGAVIAAGSGGPSHIQGADMEQVFAQAVAEAAQALIDSLGIALPSDSLAVAALQAHYLPTAVGIGLTGYGMAGKREAVSAVMNRFFPGVPAYMDNDAVIAHYGAAGLDDGASILAGTGTIAFGRYGRRRLRLGGHGYLFGDEGGGFWIGLTAIRHAIKAEEGRVPATALAASVSRLFGVESPKQLLPVIYGMPAVPVQKIAELSGEVCRCAQEGDAVARSILAHAAAELGRLAVDLIRALAVPASEPFPLFPLGGVWRAGELLVQPFLQHVHEAYPAAYLSAPKRPPAVGAAVYAMEKHGGRPLI
jgi:N-acetylglucosamine kinase-like BadF-type ATPase